MGELVRGRNNGYIFYAGLSDDVCAHLLCPPAQYKPLGADDADNQPPFFFFFDKGKNAPLIEVGGNQFPSPDRIKPEQGLFNAKDLCNLCSCRPGAEDGEHLRCPVYHFSNKLGNLCFCPLLIGLLKDLF